MFSNRWSEFWSRIFRTIQEVCASMSWLNHAGLSHDLRRRVLWMECISFTVPISGLKFTSLGEQPRDWGSLQYHFIHTNFVFVQEKLRNNYGFYKLLWLHALKKTWFRAHYQWRSKMEEVIMVFLPKMGTDYSEFSIKGLTIQNFQKKKILRTSYNLNDSQEMSKKNWIRKKVADNKVFYFS